MVKVPKNPLKKKKEEDAPEPRMDIHDDIQSLTDAIRGGNNEQEYPSGDVSSGLEKRSLDEYTTAWLLKDLFDPEPGRLPLVTVTPRSQFNVLVIGETFDEVTRQGSNRTDSIFAIFLRKRDWRAPSIDGESRRDLVGIHDSKIQTERDMGTGSMTY